MLKLVEAVIPSWRGGVLKKCPRKCDVNLAEIFNVRPWDLVLLNSDVLWAHKGHTEWCGMKACVIVGLNLVFMTINCVPNPWVISKLSTPHLPSFSKTSLPTVYTYVQVFWDYTSVEGLFTFWTPSDPFGNHIFGSASSLSGQFPLHLLLNFKMRWCYSKAIFFWIPV